MMKIAKFLIPLFLSLLFSCSNTNSNYYIYEKNCIEIVHIDADVYYSVVYKAGDMIPDPLILQKKEDGFYLFNEEVMILRTTEDGVIPEYQRTIHIPEANELYKESSIELYDFERFTHLGHKEGIIRSIMVNTALRSTILMPNYKDYEKEFYSYAEKIADKILTQYRRPR